MAFIINFKNNINLHTSFKKLNRTFLCVYHNSYRYIYLYTFDLLNNFVDNKVPLGILLDYIEDNPELIDTEISKDINTIQIIRQMLKDDLWKIAKEAATNINIEE